MLGIGYFVDCIVNAANEHTREEMYQVYETDCLYGIARSLGIKLHRRLYDLLHQVPEDGRSGEEIAEERLNRFGIKVVT